jgi:hypothetical protein
MQYFNAIEKLGLQHSEIAKTILGNSFAWIDLLAYIMGILTVIRFEKLILRQGSKRQYG